MWSRLFVCALSLLSPSSSSPIPITLAASPSRKVSHGFASFTFDWVNYQNMKPDPLTWLANATRVAAVRSLVSSGDAIIRVGGTTADRIWFDTSTSSPTPPPPHFDVVHTRAEIGALCEFANATGTRLIIGLNAGPGPRGGVPNGAWNETNSVELIKLLQEVSCPVVGYELGNEPNLFVVNFGAKGFVDPSRLAQDFSKIRTVIDAMYPDTSTRPLLIGPDVAFQVPFVGQVYPGYFKDVLQALNTSQGVGRTDGHEERQMGRQTNAVLDAVTWHWYPLQSSHCPVSPLPATPEQMVKPSTLNALSQHATDVANWVHEHSPTAELWMGETASASCGGQHNVSDALSGALWYFDQLGYLAVSDGLSVGTTRSLRQEIITASGLDPAVPVSASRYGDFSSGYYSLLSEAVEPRPSYFANALWSLLMGVDVIPASMPADSPSTLRVYASVPPASKATAEPSDPGHVTVLLLNMAANAVEVTLPNTQADTSRDEWLLASASSDLSSLTVQLNGVDLALDATTHELPPLPARHVAEGGPCVVPPFSALFVQATRT